MTGEVLLDLQHASACAYDRCILCTIGVHLFVSERLLMDCGTEALDLNPGLEISKRSTR